jgi:LmbE family N-acetylglucosaminyl deacetylase
MNGSREANVAAVADAARSTFAGQTVLAVFAHPDDESLACGGTLARLVDQGAQVVLLCASHGELGWHEGSAPGADLGTVRARELRNAAATLGVATLIVLDHPDGEMRWAHVSELRGQIVMTIRRYAPAAVITFGADGLYWHPDHIGVYERTTAAVGSLGVNAPPLYYVTMQPYALQAVKAKAMAGGWQVPATGFWSLEPEAFGVAAAPDTLLVNVRDWAPRKLAAIRCHQSQTGPHDPFAFLTDEDARQWLSVEHFHRAAGNPATAPVLELIGEPVM